MSRLNRSLFAQSPAICRELALTAQAAPAGHLVSTARTVAAPPPRRRAGPHGAYPSELTPRSRTACPVPYLSALQSERRGTERTPADRATRPGADARRQVSGGEDPDLRDNIDPYTWWKPPADIDSLGYGSDGFHFTLAIGNDDDGKLDDWAIWEFNPLDGSYEVQAWIPTEWATAHVQYLIWADENGDSRFDSDEYVAGPWLDQQTVSGWQSLGVYDLKGSVRIEVRDVRTRDDYRDVGTVSARLAVDAIRLRRVPRS